MSFYYTTLPVYPSTHPQGNAPTHSQVTSYAYPLPGQQESNQQSTYVYAGSYPNGYSYPCCLSYPCFYAPSAPSHNRLINISYFSIPNGAYRTHPRASRQQSHQSFYTFKTHFQTAYYTPLTYQSLPVSQQRPAYVLYNIPCAYLPSYYQANIDHSNPSSTTSFFLPAAFNQLSEQSNEISQSNSLESGFTDPDDRSILNADGLDVINQESLDENDDQFLVEMRDSTTDFEESEIDDLLKECFSFLP